MVKGCERLRCREHEFQRPVSRNHGTELSQYSPGPLALLFDKSCRNLSRGRFQRYCTKPRLPPLCYTGRAAFSVRPRCRCESRSPLASMPIQLASVFLCGISKQCLLLRVPLLPRPRGVCPSRVPFFAATSLRDQ